MADTRFNAVIRSLKAGASRRTVLGALAWMAGLGVGETMAKGRHRHSRKRPATHGVRTAVADPQSGEPKQGPATRQSQCSVCAEGCPYTAIRDAVADARVGGTITVAPGIYDEGLVVSKDLTIRRCGSTGDVVLRNAGVVGSVASLTILGGTVTLQDLIFTRNPNLDYGGTILNWGDLTLLDCTVTGCVSPPSVVAGGIQNGGTLTMRGGAVTNNTAAGGAGILNTDGSSLTLIGCEVSHNVAGSGGAGGIDSEDSRTSVSLKDCKITDNTSDDGGAGISCFGTLDLKNTTVSRNTSRFGFGGGIASNNQTTLTHCIVTDNSAGQDGGGIYSVGTLTVRGGTTITGNTPNDCAGTAASACPS
jgi:predicted outer membrane repeat protein